MIRKEQARHDEKRKKQRELEDKRARRAFDKDCRKTGSGANALAPSVQPDPDECRLRDSCRLSDCQISELLTKLNHYPVIH